MGAAAMPALYLYGFDGFEALGFSLMALAAALLLLGAGGAPAPGTVMQRIGAKRHDIGFRCAV